MNMKPITIELGSTPPHENPAQTTWDDFHDVNHAECRIYRDLLLRRLGPEPNGCHFSIRTFKHDFSPYKELVLVISDPDDDAVRQYSTYAEDGPKEWDEVAGRKLLGELRRTGLLGDEALLASDYLKTLRTWYDNH